MSDGEGMGMRWKHRTAFHSPGNAAVAGARQRSFCSWTMWRCVSDGEGMGGKWAGLHGGAWECMGAKAVAGEHGGAWGCMGVHGSAWVGKLVVAGTACRFPVDPLGKRL